MSSMEELSAIANDLPLIIPPAEVGDYILLLSKTKAALDTVLAEDDYQPEPDLKQTPREDVHFPTSDNEHNAWAWRCHCSHKSPSNSLLQGRTVCLKDNIAFAGVPCLVGTSVFTGWTPKTDATVATRILEAGGVIAGKAVCENLSRGAVSSTAATGPVHNPFARGYSAGGSSSGTAALVASGAVDLGIGCDQGGSVRIPASLCGLYGLKATSGLVPYTGIVSNDAMVDYVGPITRTCSDCALLLEAIAGADGLDDRQLAGTPFPKDVPSYSRMLADTKADGVKGLKIGILKEGLTSPAMQSAVLDKFQQAVKVFERLGASVSDVSVPLHEQARTMYSVMTKMSNHMGMLGQAVGRRQVMLTDLQEIKSLPYTLEATSKMSVMAKEGMLSGEFLWRNSPHAYSKAVNLFRRLGEEYNTILGDVDLIVMPTTATPSEPLPASNASPLSQMAAAWGKTENTCPFNATGHPALAMPIGMIESASDSNVKVPTSLQLVSKFWDESLLLRAAYTWENEVDWKNF
jgi:amidase